MTSETLTIREKVARLSPGLQREISFGERRYSPDPATPVSNYLAATKRHCNGGRTVDAGLWLRNHCDQGGKIFVTMAGAGSSFQVGIVLSELIRAGKIAGISVTGANLEESLYRFVAHSHYAYIPHYEKLSAEEEKELDHAGLRRITDTFLPEEESVRIVLPHMLTLWREAQATNTPRFWHEFFFLLFERNLVTFDPEGNSDDCWLYHAWRHKIPVFVGGAEDSTMGNIFSYYTYAGKHPLLAEYADQQPVNADVVHHSFRYMHALAEFYLGATESHGLAFLQLGGGIAADFPICVVPHLKKDFLMELGVEEQERLIHPWAGFIEIYSSPMSFGSYSGAGGDEKITWSKLEPGSYRAQICGDYTEHFPDIAALVLRR